MSVVVNAPRRNNVLNRRMKTLRRYVRKRGMPNLSRNIYKYVQYSSTDYALASNTVIETGKSFSFSLDKIPQYQTFTALYDEYRIKLIEFIIRPRSAIATTLSAPEGTAAQLYKRTIIYAVDHDDDNAPGSYNALREYGNAKEINTVTARDHKVFIKPAVAMQIYNGVLPAHGTRFSPWIDCGNPGVPHYGLKMAMPLTQVDNLLAVDISIRYLVEFRHVR